MHLVVVVHPFTEMVADIEASIETGSNITLSYSTSAFKKFLEKKETIMKLGLHFASWKPMKKTLK